MTTIVQGPVNPPALNSLESTNSFNELDSHPAFHFVTTKEDATKILVGRTPMTYILWTEESAVDGEIVEQHFLSYMETDLTVQHRTFSHPSDWFYQNCDPHHANALVDLIPKMMHCRSYDCKMLTMPQPIDRC
jgi:hypothetical protein